MILLTCHESTMQRAKAVGAAVLPVPPVAVAVKNRPTKLTMGSGAFVETV